MWIFDDAYDKIYGMRKGQNDIHSKWLLALLISLSIAICGLVVGIIVVINSNHAAEDTVEVGTEDIFGGWGEYINNNDGEGLIATTDEMIRSTDDAEMKSDIYAMRAGVLYNMDDGVEKYSAQILSDVYNAEECYPTGQTAYLIYYYENIFGDPAVAEKYLKIAEERGMTLPPGRG